MQNYNIEITENVFTKVRELLANKNTQEMLRIAVEGGGCSGFSYNYSMVGEEEEGDIVFDSKVVIDKHSCELLAGSKIDYKHELSGSYFSIENPQAKAKCGCGNSFSV